MCDVGYGVMIKWGYFIGVEEVDVNFCMFIRSEGSVFY